MIKDTRAELEALIEERGEDFSSISRLLGRNPAYIQQFIKRGTPRRLAEDDRRTLAAYFRVPEERLGGGDGATATPSPALITVPRIDVGASAGPGGIAEIEELGRPIAFDGALLRDIGARRTASLSIIRVKGESMEPTLRDGDDILVDRDQTTPRENAIHVLRLDDLLMVKRMTKADGRWAIHSDNMAYSDIVDFDPAALQIIGRVLWCGRKL